MAVEVKVPKDIKEYKEKVIAGMNLKQLFCLSIAAGVNIVISLIFIAWLRIPMEITSWIMILSSLPIVSYGWFKRNGVTFEVYIRHFFRYHLSPGVRKKKVSTVNNDLGGQET